MPEIRHDLLTEPIFGVEWPDGRRAALSLPDVLAQLGAGQPIEFSGLQAHQMHAWYAFVVQLAAIALHEGGEGSVNRNADSWRRLLRALATERNEPWCLLVEDLSLPAFMQPPVPKRSLAEWKNATASPDEIDLLVTAKNHDVKMRRARQPHLEHWVYALISLQTMEGYGGKKNYGIARMNRGYGNRPCIAVAGDATWATRFRRDAALLLDSRQSVVESYGYRIEHGHRLLWLLPWDGGTPIAVADCDPFFIEVCRRIRLTRSGEVLMARWTGSEVQRVDAQERKGDIGDPWTPIRVNDGAALTAKGTDYDTLQEVLFGGDWHPSPASIPCSADGEAPTVIAHVLARGQGETEGFHERLIPVSPKARSLLATPEGRERLGSLSRQRVELIATVRTKVLYPALRALTESAGPFTRALDNHIDAIFFERLFADVDQEPAAAARDFTARLLGFSREILNEATESVPLPTAQRYRAITAAERKLEGAARKWFPDVYAVKGEQLNDPSVAP